MCQVAAKVCGVEGCGGGHVAKGMCGRCYKTALNRAKGMRPKRRWGRPLNETHPELAAELVDQGLAGKVTAGTGKRLHWRCKLGHEWEAVGQKRVKGDGCPYCSGRSVWPGFNDMLTTHPSLAAELVGDPTKVIAGTRKELAWRCKIGHEWEARGDDRVRGKGCPYCANIKVMPGFNDMATTHPGLAAEFMGDPTKVVAGTHKKLHWRCKLGHEWEAKGCDRVMGKGCPECAESGYNPAKPGVFYLVRRSGQFKVGIANLEAAAHKTKGRLVKHKRNGWSKCFTAYPLPGPKAQEFEKRVIKALKALGAKFGQDCQDNAFDGYTETWSAESFDVNGAAGFWRDFMELLAAADSTLVNDFWEAMDNCEIPEEIKAQVNEWSDRQTQESIDELREYFAGNSLAA